MKKIAAMVLSALVVIGTMLLIVSLTTPSTQKTHISPAAAAGITSVTAVMHPQPNLTLAPVDVSTMTSKQVSSMQTMAKMPGMFAGTPTMQYVRFTMDGTGTTNVLSYLYHWDETNGCPVATRPLPGCSISVVVDAGTGIGEDMFVSGTS